MWEHTRTKRHVCKDWTRPFPHRLDNATGTAKRLSSGISPETWDSPSLPTNHSSPKATTSPDSTGIYLSHRNHLQRLYWKFNEISFFNWYTWASESFNRKRNRDLIQTQAHNHHNETVALLNHFRGNQTTATRSSNTLTGDHHRIRTETARDRARTTINVSSPERTPDSSAKGARTTRSKAGYTPSRGPPCTRVDTHCLGGNHRASRSLKNSRKERREKETTIPFFPFQQVIVNEKVYLKRSKSEENK